MDQAASPEAWRQLPRFVCTRKMDDARKFAEVTQGIHSVGERVVRFGDGLERVSVQMIKELLLLGLDDSHRVQSVGPRFSGSFGPPQHARGTNSLTKLSVVLMLFRQLSMRLNLISSLSLTDEPHDKRRPGWRQSNAALP